VLELKCFSDFFSDIAQIPIIKHF